MLRILHVIGSMDVGGAETFLMNLYRNMKRQQVQFDFVVHTSKKMFYEDEIKELGGFIYRAPEIKGYNFYTYRKWWKRFYQEHPEYTIVHGSIGSTASIYLGIAKKYGRFTIAHSHATSGQGFSEMVFKAMTFSTRYIADYFLGCSLEAGIDRYGRTVAESDRFKVILNGIDSSKYRFSPERREAVRLRYGVGPHTVLFGHVGRFAKVKNHEKIVRTFSNFHDKNPDSGLWLFGGGEEEEHIRLLVHALHLEDSVRFMGISDHIWDYLQAMDLFLFPSYYEGLGIALIEAQASGLPCVVSDAIQKEADIGAGLIKKVSLNAPDEAWSEAVAESLQIPRKDTEDLVKRAGFDIKEVALQMQDFYLKIGSRYGE